MLSGDPDHVVPDFAAGQNYDAVVLGAVTHRKGIAGLGGMLTSRIADAVDCDLILVGRSDRGQTDAAEPSADDADHTDSAVAEDSDGMQPSASDSSVLWQSMFGDCKRAATHGS